MENIKVLIVEDKGLVAESIASVLRNHSLEVVGMCATGEEAIQIVNKSKPDLVLMDIELAGALDGISTAKIIQTDHSIPVIYLTDFTDQKTVDRAKKTLPANYIAKPFHEADLVRAIDIAFHNANATTAVQEKPLLARCVFLRTDTQVYIKLAYQEILYLEADRAYCTIVTDNKNYKLASSMNRVHEQIDNKDFVRVHRSYVVNINRITSLDGNMIKIDGHKVQMSTDLRDELMGRLKFIQ
jgi:DNA-binding LytR/AlgR family response regulator